MPQLLKERSELRLPWILLMAPLLFLGLASDVAAQATKVDEPAAATQKKENQDQGVKQKKPDVIFVPTPQEVVDKMLELAEVKKGDVLFDLGCGDGRIVVTAAKKFGVKATGIDIDPQRIKEARANVESSGVQE